MCIGNANIHGIFASAVDRRMTRRRRHRAISKSFVLTSVSYISSGFLSEIDIYLYFADSLIMLRNKIYCRNKQLRRLSRSDSAMI